MAPRSMRVGWQLARSTRGKIEENKPTFRSAITDTFSDVIAAPVQGRAWAVFKKTELSHEDR